MGWGKFLSRFLPVFLCRIQFRHAVVLKLFHCCLIIKPSAAAPVFPSLVFLGTLSKNNCVILCVRVLAFLLVFILPQFYLCRLQCDLFSICCSKQWKIVKFYNKKVNNWIKKNKKTYEKKYVWHSMAKELKDICM